MTAMSIKNQTAQSRDSSDTAHGSAVKVRLWAM